MTKKRVKILLVALIFSLMVFLALRPRSRSAGVEVGEYAPNFSLPVFSLLPTGAGETVTLRNYRRHVVVLNFWATWCPPCVEETPSLEKFSEQMRDPGVQVIGVSVDEDPGAIQKFVADFHVTFPVARDPHQSLAARYGTFKFPESYILDRQGRLAEKIIGAIDWQDPRMMSFVRELARPGERPGP